MKTIHIVAHESFTITVLLEEAGKLKVKVQRKDGKHFVLDKRPAVAGPPRDHTIFGDFDTIESGVKFAKQWINDNVAE